MRKKSYGLILILVVFFSTLSFGMVQTPIKKVIDTTNVELKEATTTTVGAWIIIAGSRSDYHLVDLIISGCNLTYELLRDMGWAENDLLFLAPYEDSTTPYFDALSNRSTIQWAIEDWAVSRTNLGEALGIYLFSHGGIGHACLDTNQTGYSEPEDVELYDNNLSNYLDTLESKTGYNRVILVYEACHAGSFINPVSKSNRIIVTSTSIDKNAYGSWNWAWFSEAFWSTVRAGGTLGEGFESGVQNVKDVGYYHIQTPWIDDNHDEVGHEADDFSQLPNGGDGNDALNTIIAAPTGFIFKPNIYQCPLHQWGKDNDILAWVKVNNYTNLKKVYMRVRKPGWEPIQPPIPPHPEGNLLEDNADLVEMKSVGDGNYSGGYQSEFGDGDYMLDFYAQDEKGGFSKVVNSYFTLNPSGEPPTDTTAPTVWISKPLTGTSVSSTINITASGDDDQALDRIELYIDDVLVENETMPDYYPYPEVVHPWTPPTGDHTIKAIAYDKAGQSNTTSVVVSNSEEIPSFTLTIVIFGSFLVIIAYYYIIQKKKPLKFP